MIQVASMGDLGGRTKITHPHDAGHLPTLNDRPILHQFFKDPPDGIMKIMLFLILVSLTVAAGFLLAFLFASRNGQFDDDCTPAIRMLFDDTTPKEPTNNQNED